MSGPRSRLAALVAFDHWSWLAFVIWFAGATVLTFLGSTIGAAVTYWGIVAVLADNVIRLLVLAAHFKSERKSTYLGLTMLLIVALVASILFQVWVH